jgi:hypothetical protein
MKTSTKTLKALASHPSFKLLDNLSDRPYSNKSFVNSMPQSSKDTWIKALRSGEYTQGKHKLSTINDDGDTCYCCLGVLQKVISDKVESRKALPSKEWADAHGMAFSPHGRRYNQTDANPTFAMAGKVVPLAALNDAFNYSFEQIADLIETQIEGV